jgi:hypothetical protein
MKRWKKMAKYETFNAFMTALVAYAPFVGVIAYFTGGEFGFLFSGLFTLGFWLFVTSYFVWDYRETHKKRKPKATFPPLTSDTKMAKEVEKTKPTTKIKLINWFFFSLEIIEAALFFFIAFWTWRVFEINGVFPS